MPYTTDWKPTKPENPKFVCRVCGSDDVWYRKWEDSECHQDLHYHCRGCGRKWWFEGIDS